MRSEISFKERPPADSTAASTAPSTKGQSSILTLGLSKSSKTISVVMTAEPISIKIITNDFNLNKVAQLRGVSVLNINELSNAVKPVVIPGETMKVQVVKDGKEPGQGVAYLDDGTMIVIENGHRYLSRTISVEVTSALQTSAGRMIFAKPR